MAKILLGPTVIGIRGTVAGLIFSQNRGGPYARGWARPPDPGTALQSDQRTKLGNWAVAWRALTGAQQATWTAYAAAPAQALVNTLGQTYYASGANWYATINTANTQCGQPILVNAPVAAAPAAPVVGFVRFRTTANPNPVGSLARYSFADPTIGLMKIIFIIIVGSKGILVSPATKYFMIASLVDINPNIAFNAQQIAKFGNTYNTMRMFFETYNVSAEGRASAPTMVTTDGIDVG